MHYYPFNITDFSQSTKHLSIVRRGIYRELIDLYYDKEKPLINDPERLALLILAPDYSTDVEQVLNEFFTLVDNVWVNEKCEEVITEYKNKLDNASKAGKASAKARARKLKASKDLTGVEQPLDKCSTNQELITNNQELITKAKIPYSAIAELYNSCFADKAGQSHIAKLTDKRKRLIKSAWLFDTDNQNEKLHSNNLKYWERYFTHCSGIGFFRHDAKRDETHKNWQPDFEFVIKPDTQLKVRENKYGD